MPTHQTLDRTGVFLSFTCAVHCLFLPLLLLLPSTLGLGFLLHETTEFLLLGSGILLAVCSFCWGFYRHGRGIILLFLALALILIGSGLLAGDPLIRWLTVPGSILIAGTHLLNQRLCRSCPRCPPDPAAASPSMGETATENPS